MLIIHWPSPFRSTRKSKRCPANTTMLIDPARDHTFKSRDKLPATELGREFIKETGILSWGTRSPAASGPTCRRNSRIIIHWWRSGGRRPVVRSVRFTFVSLRAMVSTTLQGVTWKGVGGSLTMTYVNRCPGSRGSRTTANDWGGLTGGWRSEQATYKCLKRAHIKVEIKQEHD